MSKTILVGIDGSERGLDALALGRLLAEGTGAELVATHVYERATPGHAGWGSFMWAHGERTLLDAVGEESAIRQEIIESSSPSRGLHELAEREHAELIVVGSGHHAGLGRVLVGSVGERVLHGAPCGVAVAPAGYRDQDPELKLVCVGFDGMPESEAALARAIELARTTGASLRVVTVIDPIEVSLGAKGNAFAGAGDLARAREELMRSHLDRGLALVPDDIEASGVLSIPGMPTLAEQEDVDALVVGSRGYGPIRRLLLGSVSTRLVRSAPCPVIMYPRTAEGAGEGSNTDRDRGVRPDDTARDPA